MYTDLPIRMISFGGHETFPMRFGWLKKGYDALTKDPDFFASDKAMTVLGVGKNMVRAIRFWGLACQMWTEQPATKGANIEVTAMAHAMLAEDGWDPYMEDINSVWWLHWLLVTNSRRASAWGWMFARPKAARFSSGQLVTELMQLAEANQVSRLSLATIKRDVEVLIRSYTRLRPAAKTSLEESFDSPFVLLGLMRAALGKHEYELISGPQTTLRNEIFEAALLDYVIRVRARQSASISLDEIAYAPMAPGRAFRLSEDAITARLISISQSNRDLYKFDDTAGLRQLMLLRSPRKPEDALALYYGATEHRHVAQARGAV